MCYPLQTSTLVLIKMSSVNETKKRHGTDFVNFQNSFLQIVKILDKDQDCKPPIISKQIIPIQLNIIEK